MTDSRTRRLVREFRVYDCGLWFAIRISRQGTSLRQTHEQLGVAPIVGFTASTGSRFQTLEFDNLTITKFVSGGGEGGLLFSCVPAPCLPSSSHNRFWFAVGIG